MAAIIDQANTALVLSRARQRKSLRGLVMSQLYPTTTTNTSTDPVLGYGQVRDPLTTLANTFSRYAQTQQTAYETGANHTSATGSTNLMERQVSQAIAQVLGRSPGRNPDSFVSALRDAFPCNGNGKITFTPSRSTVSLYSQNGNYTANGSIAAGLMGQLSSEQAALYRQASIVAGDALRVLEGLHPFVPDAELDRVEALRKLVQTEIKSLVDEFGRIDEPRPQRVDNYFNQLNGANGHLFQMGDRAFLDRRSAAPATIDDEAQIAGYELLKNYVTILKNIWDTYNKPAKSTAFPLFSERLSRASVLLPVIAEGNINFMSALDSIGFTENERRSSASKFTTLGTGEPELPDITVSDLNEWIDRFASMEAPSILADSGQYGLQFVTEQADSIFWTIVPILTFTKTALALKLSRNPIVAQALEHERVTWAFDDLVNQLNALADLSA